MACILEWGRLQQNNTRILGLMVVTIRFASTQGFHDLGCERNSLPIRRASTGVPSTTSIPVRVPAMMVSVVATGKTIVATVPIPILIAITIPISSAVRIASGAAVSHIISQDRSVGPVGDRVVSADAMVIQLLQGGRMSDVCHITECGLSDAQYRSIFRCGEQLRPQRTW